VGAAVVSDSDDDIRDEDQARRGDESNGDEHGGAVSQSSSSALGQKSAAALRDDSGVERAALAAKTDSLWASLRETDAPRATTSATAPKSSAASAAVHSASSPSSSSSASSVASSSSSPAAASTTAAPAAATAEPSAGFTARGKPKLDFTKRTKSTAEIEREKQMVVHKEIEFAGERVSVATTLDKDSAEAKKIVAQGKPSGLDTVLSQWTQLKQMTTFDKSKVDWERDKAVVGDEHELAQARKNGFLEKAQFLKQVDQNQYEREREERLRLAASRHRSAAL
jgi:hypothetical protein